MDTLSAIAASGMRARMEELDILANNLANTSSQGYKSDREMYGLYASVEASGSDEGAAADSAVDQVHLGGFFAGDDRSPPAILWILLWWEKDF